MQYYLLVPLYLFNLIFVFDVILLFTFCILLILKIANRTQRVVSTCVYVCVWWTSMEIWKKKKKIGKNLPLRDYHAVRGPKRSICTPFYVIIILLPLKL